MKKLFALLLALVLVLSLAACGGGNSDKPPDGGNDSPGASQQEQDESTKNNSTPEGSNAEFTIYVNGSEEWTPFSGKSGVTFSVADENLISVSDNGKKISFTGKQVGETVITATLDGAECEALVRVRAMKQGPVPLNFTPPTAVKATYIKKYGGEMLTYNCVYFAGKSFSINDPTMEGNFIIHNTPTVQYTCSGGKWQYFVDPSDDRSFLHDWSGDRDWGETGEHLFAGFAYELIARTKLGGSYTTDDITVYKLDKPQETVAGIQCDLYYFKPSVAADYIAMRTGFTFWVDPETHYTLKYSSDDGKDYYEIIEFDANYTGIDDMAPPTYDHSQMREAG